MHKLFAAQRRHINRLLPKQAIVAFRQASPFKQASLFKQEAVFKQAAQFPQEDHVQADEALYWVAELACGHLQQVRHQPPFFNCPWLMTQAGRSAMLGCLLACKKCPRPEPKIKSQRI